MERKFGSSWILVIGFVLVLMVFVMGTADTSLAEKPFYQGKTVSLVVSSAPGGGTDFVARQISSLLPKYLPGRPRIVVRSKPGGSGTLALNSFYNKSKPDGSTLLVTGASVIALYMQKAKIAKFDLRKMPFLGVLNIGGSLVVIRKEALKRLTDPKAEPVVVGCKEARTAWAFMILMGQEFAGWNLRWILGFKGASDMELAFRRGEIDMMSGTRQSKTLIKEGLAVGVVQSGLYKKGKFSRRPDWADYPTMVEVLGDKKPTGLPWQGYMAATGGNFLHKSFLAPPGTPDHIVKIHRDAFAKMVQDDKFLKIWYKVVSPVLNAYTGDDIEPVVNEILDVSPEAAGYMIKLRRKFGAY
jgi:tripartite-type tricarboxylate transporter receptor subunit TctC